MPLRSLSKMLNGGTLPAETFWKANSLENREAHASHIRPPPGAEMRSRPRSAALAVEAQRRALTDTGAEGKSFRTSECSVNF